MGFFPFYFFLMRITFRPHVGSSFVVVKVEKVSTIEFCEKNSKYKCLFFFLGPGKTTWQISAARLNQQMLYKPTMQVFTFRQRMAFRSYVIVKFANTSRIS